MNLIPAIFRSKKEAIEAPSIKKTTEINKNNYKNFLIKTIGLISKQGAGRENFEYPEFDLEEIKLASMADSYIKQSFMKYSYLIYKAGYSIKSDNDTAADYIKKRFRIMSFSTEKPFDILMQEIGDDLIKYSNAFLIKSRAPIPFNTINAKGVFSDYPVAGYFRIDPTTIQIKRDDNGKIIQYMQKVNGIEKKYKKEDVIHFYLDKDPNHNFGTPRIIAALEDVKLLRKIEGNVISLIYRFAIPLYQWIIGRPDSGMQASDKEIEEAKYEIEKLALDGNIVTNERTEIKAIGAEGHALDASQYLAYFEKRTFTALGVSESQMGRGGAKQDANSMEAQAHDTVKYIQRTLSIFIENFILNEMLLEGGFDPITNESDIVRYVFEETSLETKVKVENHEILKYQSNVKTLEETRRDLGMKQELDEERLYNNLINSKAAIDQIEAQKEASIEIADSAHENSKEMADIAAKNAEKAAKQQSDNVKGNGQIAKDNSSTNNVQTRNRPQNQHGQTSAKIKESFSMTEAFFDDTVRKDAEENKKVFQSVYNKWVDVRNDILRGEDPDILFGVLKDGLLKDIHSNMLLSIQDGRERAMKELERSDLNVNALQVPTTQLEEYIEKKVRNLLKDVRKHIHAPEDADNAFDTYEYRLRYLLEYTMPKAYWLSYGHTCKAYGYNEIYVHFHDSKDKEDHKEVIDLDNFDWLSIPPFHSFCTCEVALKREGNK